jgi:hypothetical protein
LIAFSNALVETERRRCELIESMWSEQLAAQAHSAAHTDRVPDIPVASPLYASAAIPDAAGAAAPSVAPPPFPASEPQHATATDAAIAPRRSGVQVFLLAAGIVLLAVFTLFFLTVAYLFATVEVRVVVTALAGLVTFGVAWVLKRRRLPATAEGVGVAGAAILVGTLGFVRAAELFGSATISPTLFSGLGLLVVAGLVEVLHRTTALRFARIGSLLLCPTGLALTVIAVLDPFDAGAAWWAGLMAAGTSTLLVRDGTERAVEAAMLRSIAVSSMTAALIPAALLLPEAPGSSALAYSVSALAWGALVLRLRHESGLRTWSCTASVLLGLSVSLAPAVAILRAAPAENNLWAPGIVTGLVAVVTIVLSRRSSHALTRRTLSWAQIPAVVVAAVGLLPGVGFALVHVLASIVPRYPLWAAHPGDMVAIIPNTGVWAAVLAPGVAAVFGSVAIRLVRVPKPVLATVGSLAGLALLAAASHGGSVLLVLLGYLLVAVFGLSMLFLTRGRRAPAVRWPAAVMLAVAGLALFVLSHANSELWPAGVLAVVGLTTAARFAVSLHSLAPPAIRAVFTALAAATLFAEATLVVRWLSAQSTDAFFATTSLPNPIDFAALPGAAAALLLCVTPLIMRRGRNGVVRCGADLRAAAIVALPVATIGSAVVFMAGATTPIDHVARIAVPLLLAVAGVLWQIRDSVAHVVEHVFLASLVPICIGAALSSTADAASASSELLADFLPGPATVILCAALGVLVFRRAALGLRSAARVAWHSANALLLVVAVARAVANAGDSTWLILLLLAVAPLIVAFADGDPFTSGAPRRHFSMLSVILAVAALWQFLAFRGVSDVEPYSLPVGVLLLCIGTALALFGRRSTSTVAGRSTFFAAGLVSALAPSALMATTESSERAVVVLIIAAALATAALSAPRVVRGVLVRDSTLILALAVLVTVGLACTVHDAGRNTILIPEFWVLPAALGLTATSIVWTRRQALPFRAAQLGIPAAIALIGTAAMASLVALPERDAPARLAIASGLLAVVAVGAGAHRRVPLDRVSQYTALSLLILIAITGLATTAAHPFELSTVPLALALIASGVIALLRDRAARSWPNLGPGIAVLLAPPLLADFSSTDLWRVIALGVLSVVVVVVAVALRLQAPLVVGAAVLIVHALAQSWPWIEGLYSAVPWWIWLGVGGVALIAVAARYEHRVRNLRSFVGSIAALR